MNETLYFVHDSKHYLTLLVVSISCLKNHLCMCVIYYYLLKFLLATVVHKSSFLIYISRYFGFMVAPHDII